MIHALDLAKARGPRRPARPGTARDEVPATGRTTIPHRARQQRHTQPGGNEAQHRDVVVGRVGGVRLAFHARADEDAAARAVAAMRP